MNAEKTGKLIYELRTKKNLTQKQLADMINVSDKAVSKWERGDGCPDVDIIPNLSKVLGVEIENILNGVKNSKSSQNLSNVKIKIYDFKRPDVWSREQLGIIYEMSSKLATVLNGEFASIRNENCNLMVSCIDQLTNEEFLRSVPSDCFFYEYDYGKAGFAIEIDPQVGKQLLKQDYEKLKVVEKFDLDVAKHFFADKIAAHMTTQILNRIEALGNPVEKARGVINKSFSKSYNHPSVTLQNRTQMCVLISIKCEIGGVEGYINIQLSHPYTGLMLDSGFFWGNEPEVKIQYLSDVKSEKLENNIFVEFGRFKTANVEVKPGKILVFEKKYFEPLNILHNNKVIHNGEVVVADENFGVRIVDIPERPDITYNEEDYICVRLGKTALLEDEIPTLKEHSVIQLDSIAGEPMEVLLNGRKIAVGEIVVVDDYLGIRIIRMF